MTVVNQMEHSMDMDDSDKDETIPTETTTPQNAQSGEPEPSTPISEGTPSAKSTVPDDHPTKLGRRVSKMEERMTDMFDKIDSLMGKLDHGIPQRVPEYSTSMEYDEVPEHVKETVTAVKKELAKEAAREQEMQQKYATNYIKAVQRGFGDVDEELHNTVVKELTETNFRNYKKHTGDPIADAEINYTAAIAAVLRRQRTVGKVAPNVHGDKPHAPTDVSSHSRLDGPPEKKIELDEYSRKFLRAIGAKEDDPWVLESLKGTGK